VAETGLKVTKSGCFNQYDPISELSGVMQNWLKAKVFVEKNELNNSQVVQI